MTNSAINEYIQTGLSSGRNFEDIIKEITDTINEASAQHEKEKTLYPYRQPIYQMENDVDLINEWFDADGKLANPKDIDPLLDAISRILFRVLIQKEPELFEGLSNQAIEEARKNMLGTAKTLVELRKPAAKKVIDKFITDDDYEDIFKNFFKEFCCCE